MLHVEYDPRILSKAAVGRQDDITVLALLPDLTATEQDQFAIELLTAEEYQQWEVLARA